MMTEGVRVAIIGIGTISRFVLRKMADGMAGDVHLCALAARPDEEAALRSLAEEYGCSYTLDASGLPDSHPNVVIEAASPDAVRDHAVNLLASGSDLLVLSVGAFSDQVLLDAVTSAAIQSRRHVYLPSGALGGLDSVRAASVGGITDVELVTRKSLAALSGAPFFRNRELPVSSDVEQAMLLFDGPAVEGVSHFPSNVNVAASLGLAGVGLDRTRLKVLAQPHLSFNEHRLTFKGDFGSASLEFRNRPSPENPKTSFLAALSVVAALRAITSPVRFV